MNRKQKDIILKCAIDICVTCDNREICQDVLECNTRMTLEGLAEEINYVVTDGQVFGATEEIKKFSGDNPFHLIYEVI